MTKTERLLREMRHTGGMTFGEMVQFVLDMQYGFGNETYDSTRDRGVWGATLFGTRDRVGVLERYCEQDNTTGKYHVVRKIVGPYCPRRRQFDIDSYSYQYAW